MSAGKPSPPKPPGKPGDAAPLGGAETQQSQMPAKADSIKKGPAAETVRRVPPGAETVRRVQPGPAGAAAPGATPPPATQVPLSHMRPHDKLAPVVEAEARESAVFLPEGALPLDGQELVEYDIFKNIAVKDIDSLINR